MTDFPITGASPNTPGTSGADNFLINASISGKTLGGAGGIDTLTANVATVSSSGNTFIGFSIFQYGTNANPSLYPQFFFLEPSDVPANATIIGNNPDPNAPLFQKNWFTLTLGAGDTSYDASGWTLQNFADSNDAVFLDGHNATSGVALRGP